MDFSYIKEELNKQGKSISWLAKEIGVSKGYISKLINNKISEPGISKINAINKVLNYSTKTTTKDTYLLNLEKISIEKYLWLLENKNNTKLLLYCPDKKLLKKKWIVFADFDYQIINNNELVKLEKEVDIYTFNTEFELLNAKNIELNEDDYLPIHTLYQQLTLLISDDAKKLSQLITLLKLDNNFFIEDLFEVKNDIDKLHIIDFSRKNRTNYIIGNGLELSNHNDFIDYEAYLASFDSIIYCKFNKISKEKIPKRTLVIEEANMPRTYDKLKDSLMKVKG